MTLALDRHLDRYSSDYVMAYHTISKQDLSKLSLLHISEIIKKNIAYPRPEAMMDRDAGVISNQLYPEFRLDRIINDLIESVVLSCLEGCLEAKGLREWARDPELFRQILSKKAATSLGVTALSRFVLIVELAHRLVTNDRLEFEITPRYSDVSSLSYLKSFDRGTLDDEIGIQCDLVVLAQKMTQQPLNSSALGINQSLWNCLAVIWPSSSRTSVVKSLDMACYLNYVIDDTIEAILI